MGAFSPAHWLIVALIILLLFGATRLSEIGKGLGEGIKNFKKGIQDDPEPDKDAEADTKSEKQSKRLPPKKKLDPAEESEEADEERA